MPANPATSYVVHAHINAYDSNLIGVWHNQALALKAATEYANQHAHNTSIIETWQGPNIINTTTITWLPPDMASLTPTQKNGTLHHVSVWTYDSNCITALITKDLRAAQTAGFEARNKHTSNYLQAIITTWHDGKLQPETQVLYGAEPTYENR